MGVTIDLAAIAANWRALAAVTGPAARTGAVVKADAYGLGAQQVVPALATAGARDFFVYAAPEGQAIRALVGPQARIFVMEGHVPGAPMDGLIPCLASPEQFFRDRSLRPGGPFAVQIDTGMNRVGFAPEAWADLRAEVLAAGPVLLMSHLAAADVPDDPANARQLALFRALTDGAGVPRSLAATGGTLLGPDYRFDLVRPGIGLYGGLPFAQAQAVLRVALPVVQTRWVEAGTGVGYNGAWMAPRRTRIATVSGGYADGIPRVAAGRGLRLWAEGTAVPVVGRISMDAITCDVTDLTEVPPELELIGPRQPIDAYAAVFSSIGYEALTALGRRYPRRYLADG